MHAAEADRASLVEAKSTPIILKVNSKVGEAARSVQGRNNSSRGIRGQERRLQTATRLMGLERGSEVVVLLREEGALLKFSRENGVRWLRLQSYYAFLNSAV